MKYKVTLEVNLKRTFILDEDKIKSNYFFDDFEEIPETYKKLGAKKSFSSSTDKEIKKQIIIIDKDNLEENYFELMDHENTKQVSKVVVKKVED